MPMDWIEEVEGLGSDMLTVRAQALRVDDVDRLLHPVFFPYEDAESVKIKNIFELDDRVVSDRRDWNQRGRLIPTELPSIDEIEMVPIEAYDKIGEREQQEIRERAMNNEEVYRRVIQASVPGRVDKLVRANFRRSEIDAMEGWTKGQVTVRNPHKETGNGSAKSYTVPLGFGEERLQTAGTAWDDGAINAYDELVAWLEDAQDAIGPLLGVALRRSLLKAIQRSAPTMTASQRLTRGDLEERIADELGTDFSFFLVETSFDVFKGAGLTKERLHIFPDGYLAAIPQSGRIGSTYRAPVVRAMELAAQFPQAGIDVRGQTVYYDYENGGRTAVIECQANHLPLPSERSVYTIDTLVTA